MPDENLDTLPNVQAFAVVLQPIINPVMQVAVKHFGFTIEEVWDVITTRSTFTARTATGAPDAVIDLSGAVVRVMPWVDFEKAQRDQATRQQIAGAGRLVGVPGLR